MTNPTDKNHLEEDNPRSFIESWVPIDAKDKQFVKEAKVQARNEFVKHYTKKLELEKLKARRDELAELSVAIDQTNDSNERMYLRDTRLYIQSRLVEINTQIAELEKE